MGIITIPNIELNDGVVQVVSAKGNWVNLHYQQGQIGGACAVYSVAFCMLYEQMVNDIETKGRSRGDRLLRELFDRYGMIRSGFYFIDLKAIIDKFKKKSWKVDVIEGSPKRCVEGICQEIDAERTPIIGIEYKGSVHGHAMLAVGYEFDKYEKKPTKILCLDPGAPAPKTAIWNSYIDVRDLRKPSTYVNNDPQYEPSKCRLTDYLVLHNTDWDNEDECHYDTQFSEIG